MNKNLILYKNICIGLAVVAAVLAFPDLALAQDAGSTSTGEADLGGAAGHLQTNVGAVAPLVSALFWVAGGVLMGAGALKLKEHAENPAQTPVRMGIARLAVGAALLTIPFFSQFVINTMAAGDDTPVAYKAFANPGAATDTSP